MATSGISAAGFHAASQQAMQSLSPHKHNAHHHSSLSDIDAQGSSVATAPSATGKLGSKIDVTT